MAKILILDIETAPNIAYVWRFFKENVGAKQVLEHTTIMSFAAKWLGEDDVWYVDARVLTEREILESLIELLDIADIVVAHNGDKFDLPTIRGRALVLGIKPCSPYKTIDTCLVARREFNFPSNSLEYLSNILGVSKKDDHKEFPGFLLWSECLKGNIKAWKEMEKYNIQDIDTLEEVYLRMRPYMRQHPNVAIYEETNPTPACPKCGSHHIHYRGFAFTNVGRYHRFVCNDCGGWGRSRYTLIEKDERIKLMANAVG